MRHNQSRNSVKTDDTSRFGNAKLKLTGALTAGALVCFSALTLISSASNRPEPVQPKASAALASSPSVAQAIKHQPSRLVKFSLFEDGIYPREVHIQQGLIAITIEDYSGSSPGLVVERENSTSLEQVGRVERAGAHWRGRQELKLTPASYWLHMADRPDNRALLVVEP